MALQPPDGDVCNVGVGRAVHWPHSVLVQRGICTAQEMDVSGSAAKLCGRLSSASFL